MKYYCLIMIFFCIITNKQFKKFTNFLRNINLNNYKNNKNINRKLKAVNINYNINNNKIRGPHISNIFNKSSNNICDDINNQLFKNLENNIKFNYDSSKEITIEFPLNNLLSKSNCNCFVV